MAAVTEAATVGFGLGVSVRVGVAVLVGEAVGVTVGIPPLGITWSKSTIRGPTPEKYPFTVIDPNPLRVSTRSDPTWASAKRDREREVSEISSSPRAVDAPNPVKLFGSALK